MRRLVLLAICSACAAGFALAPAMAQQGAGEFQRFVIMGAKARAPAAASTSAKPYQAVEVKLPAASDEAGFETFRQEFAAVAKSRVYAELARLVMMQGFFWDRDFNGGFNRQQPGVDNLATAVRLESRNGMGWNTLATFAAETSAAPLTGRLGIICGPAEPGYDGVEFDHLTDETRSSARDWATPRADKTVVRSGPQSSAKVIDTLGLALVRVLDIPEKDKDPDAVRTAWARVATPAGKIGYVAPGTLTSLAAARLCYGKDGFGRWRIAGFVGAE